MVWVYPHFTEKEMQCKCGCKGLPKPEFMERLEKLRVVLGFALPVTSGYRCPEYNAAISDTGFDGPHTFGLAADIAAVGPRARLIVYGACALGFTGIGVKQKGEHSSRFIHVDTLPEEGNRHPRPWIWSY